MTSSNIRPHEDGGESSLLRAYNWWCEGLAAALAWVAHALRPPRRFQLRTLVAPFALNPISGSRERSPIGLPDEPARGVPPKVLQQTRGGVIEVVVPSAAIIERRLNPLPSESRPYVESVVQHQIEGLFPWRAADALRTVQVRDRDDGRLDVSVRATARPAVAPALAIAAACGARELVVSAVGDSAHAGAPASIRVPIGVTDTRASNIARYAVAGLLVLAAVVAGWTAYVHWSLAADLAALDERIATQRTALKQASAAGDHRGSGLEARKQQAVVAVAVVETLSAILPDNTHLTELALDGGRLRISGVSARATELVPLLEGSGKFKNASFYAPTTRVAGGTADRFSIEAVVVPQAQTMP
jgi:general secretion pathway protein L